MSFQSIIEEHPAIAVGAAVAIGLVVFRAAGSKGVAQAQSGGGTITPNSDYVTTNQLAELLGSFHDDVTGQIAAANPTATGADATDWNAFLARAESRILTANPTTPQQIQIRAQLANYYLPLWRSFNRSEILGESTGSGRAADARNTWAILYAQLMGAGTP